MLKKLLRFPAKQIYVKQQLENKLYAIIFTKKLLKSGQIQFFGDL
jgi:hypothetical protein